MVSRLSVIGGGKVARVIARALYEAGCVEVDAVYNRVRSHSEEAVQFIGAGRSVEFFEDVLAAEVLLVGVSDSQLSVVNEQFQEHSFTVLPRFVFHLSGALPPTMLSALRQRCIPTASLHLLRSVVSAEETFSTLAGSFASLVGDTCAVTELRAWMSACRISTFERLPEESTIYHAGNCFLANYIVTVLDAGLRCYEASGVTRVQAAAYTSQMVEEVVRRFFSSAGSSELSGPVRRGDMEVVNNHAKVVSEKTPGLCGLHDALVEQTMRIVEAQEPALQKVFGQYRKSQTQR